MIIKNLIGIIALATGVLLTPLTSAHVGVVNKVYSNSYSEIELSIPHGCEGFDTVKIEVSLPNGLTGVRAFDSVFGPATVDVDEAGVVTKIVWTAQKVEPYPSDSHAYSVSFRTKTPDAAFTTLFFPTVQTCKDFEGNIYISEWLDATVGHGHDANSEILPAPSVLLYPKVSPGWSQYTATNHMHDMSIFSDAEIVWKGTAAFSANTNTMQMIKDDINVSELSEIHSGETFWVKY